MLHERFGVFWFVNDAGICQFSMQGQVLKIDDLNLLGICV